jgi:hypothetical protein
MPTPENAPVDHIDLLCDKELDWSLVRHLPLQFDWEEESKYKHIGASAEQLTFEKSQRG